MPAWIIMAAMGEAEISTINPLFIELPESGTWDIRISLGGVNVDGISTGVKYWRSVQVYMPPSETKTDKTYLNVLGALGEGEFAGIDTSTIEIDNNPIGNYDSSTIEINTRNGANDDKLINGFNEIHAYTNFSYGLNNLLDTATHTTTGTEIEAIAITLALNGLYRLNDEGKVYTWDVTYRVEWKLHSATTWSSADSDEVTISMKQQTQFTKQYRKDHLPAGQYDIRVTRLSDAPDFRHIGNMAWTQLDEIRYDDLAYPNLAKVAMKILATEKLSGTIPNITVVAKGRKVLQPKILNAGGDWLHYDDYYYDWDNQKYVEFATDSEAFWDGVTWVEDWTANPVWIMYDLWRTSRPGISDYVDGEIHTENLPEMANYSDSLVLTEEGGDTYEKRFRMDVCVDAEQRAADLFRTLASTFRAFVFQTGGKMKLVIDKEETVSQKFTMGNIVTKGGKTTFKSAFSSLKSSPNVVEVQYLDQSQNYQRNVVLFEDSEALAAGEPIRKQSLSLMLGVARTSQALRMAKYYMYLSKYCVRASSFNAALDAVTATCGDLISIQHDVTGWGYGGRVGSGSTTSKVTLDGSVILAAGTTYELLIRFNDDTIERRDITSAAGTHTSITVSAPFSQIPAKYDLWEIVTKALGEKMFKIISVGRDNLEEVDITGLEYNESIYDDVTGIVLPTPNYSLLRRNAPVTDLTLSESTARLKDGTVEMAINVSFNKPEQAIAYSHAKIYISENDGESWECAGETSETFFTIVGGVYELTTYKVAVSSVTKTGEELSENKWATATITTSGKLLPPEDITGFSVTQSYDKLVLDWDAVSDLDVSYYEIRRGASWDSGVVISRTQQIEIELLSFPFGYQKYYIKARDTSGNYSVNPAFASITVTEIPGKIPILSLLDSALTGDVGAGLDTEYYEGRNLGRFEKCVLLTTQRVWDEDSKTWDEVESEGIRYDYPVESVGYYTGEVQDIGFKASVFISPEVDILAEGDEATHIIEERHSDDNVVWTDWAELESGATECRYIQFRIKLQTTDEDVNIRLFSLGANVNLPEVIEYQNNVAIADIGTTIEFNKTFHTDALGIVVTVIGNPYIPYITDITKDDVKVFLNDGSDDVAGNVNIVITGF
jgi:predicted phage tail protein